MSLEFKTYAVEAKDLAVNWTETFSPQVWRASWSGIARVSSVVCWAGHLAKRNMVQGSLASC